MGIEPSYTYHFGITPRELNPADDHNIEISERASASCSASSISCPPNSQIHMGDLSLQRKTNFLKRIPDNEWNAAIQKIEQRNHLVSEDELQALRSGKWTHPVFQDQDWIFFAFHAYLEKTLDLDTMCKLFLYHTCGEQTRHDMGEPQASRLQTFQLFKESGELDPNARAFLQDAVGSYLDNTEFELLLQKLRSLPPESTQFFAVRREHDPALAVITDRNEYISWDFFTVREERPDHPQEILWQTVASPEFMYAIHSARFGENAVMPSPSLGYAEKEKLSDPNARVVSIPSFASLPDQLHGLDARPLTFYHHDIVYHHAIESANQHRPLWIAFAQFVKSGGMTWAFPILLDREFLNYLKERKQSEPDNFWIGFAFCASSLSHNWVFLGRENSGENFKEVFDHFLYLFKEFFFLNQDILTGEYGLNLDSLQNCIFSRVRDPLQEEDDAKFLQTLYVFLDIPQMA